MSLEFLSVVIAGVVWIRKRWKPQPSFIADMLLVGRTESDAIMLAYEVLNDLETFDDFFEFIKTADKHYQGT